MLSKKRNTTLLLSLLNMNAVCFVGMEQVPEFKYFFYFEAYLLAVCAAAAAMTLTFVAYWKLSERFANKKNSQESDQELQNPTKDLDSPNKQNTSQEKDNNQKLGRPH